MEEEEAPSAPVARKGKRRAKNGEDNPEAVAPPTKSGRTALGKSKQPAVAVSNGNGGKEVIEKPKGKGLARAASAQSKEQVSGELTLTEESSKVIPGTLYCFGTNECGELGLKCEKRRYPALVPELKDKKIIAVACGGLHTIVLEDNGNVWSFGCNDEKALGRHNENEGEDDDKSYLPGLVSLPTKVTHISAGDSHSAALTEDGKVYAWGTFKDGNTLFGLIADDGDICRGAPAYISGNINVKIVKISSGAHHIAMLGHDGKVYTCGGGAQGQLGRRHHQLHQMVTRSLSPLGRPQISRREYLLKPAMMLMGANTKCIDVWTGEYSTYVKSNKNEIYVCGFNNYCQLGIPSKDATDDVVEKPTKKNSFQGKKWKQIAAGRLHALALDEHGTVYTLGKSADGRLGLGEVEPGRDRYSEPTIVEGLGDKKCIQVAAGSSTSYAITSEGHLYAWGFGENYQLATGDEEDRNEPFRCREKPNIDLRELGIVRRVDAGGQQVALMISPQS